MIPSVYTHICIYKFKRPSPKTTLSLQRNTEKRVNVYVCTYTLYNDSIIMAPLVLLRVYTTKYKFLCGENENILCVSLHHSNKPTHFSFLLLLYTIRYHVYGWDWVNGCYMKLCHNSHITCGSNGTHTYRYTFIQKRIYTSFKYIHQSFYICSPEIPCEMTATWMLISGNCSHLKVSNTNESFTSRNPSFEELYIYFACSI